MRRCDHVTRANRQRETVWEALDEMPAGREFTIDQLWRQRGVNATHSMVATVVRDAVSLGLVERLGRLPAQGRPLLLRMTGKPLPRARAEESEKEAATDA